MFVILILSSIFLGCVEEKETGAVTPTPAPEKPSFTPAVTPTAVPTPVSTTPAVTPAPLSTSRETTTYIVWLDTYRINRVRALRDSTYVNLPSGLDVYNLTIHAGDKVRWVNDDSSDFPLTIISKEGLWSERGDNYLRWQGDSFEYTFNKIGSYTVYVKEYPRIQQKINVKP